MGGFEEINMILRIMACCLLPFALMGVVICIRMIFKDYGPKKRIDSINREAVLES